MIILDTNVVSEAMKLRRDPVVVAWLDNQSASTLYLTATSLSELTLCIAILPRGKRKDGLSAGLSEILENYFGPRILPFDKDAAIAYGEIVGAARIAGKSVSTPDGQIGAIAKVHKFTVATRDTAPFMALEIPVVNPWTE
jgi:toxin FitB